MRMWRQSNPCTLLAVMRIGAAFKENSMECLHRLKIELLCYLGITLTGKCSKEMKLVS